MIRSALVISILGIASLVSAQPIPIHPDCPAVSKGQVYNSPKDWTWDDDQAHWAAHTFVNGMGVDMPGHTHIRVGHPECGIVTGGLITLPVEILGFHSDGVVGGDGGIYRGSVFPSLVSVSTSLTGQAFKDKYGATTASWPDATQTSFPLYLHATTLETMFAEVTLDLSSGELPKHGWGVISFCLNTNYTDARAGFIRQCRSVVFYSEIDPSAPEVNGLGSFVHNSTAIGATSFSDFTFGSYNVTALWAHLPIDPVSAGNPVAWPFAWYPYAPPPGTPSEIDIRLDANLHAGIQGTLLFSQTGFDELTTNFTFPTPEIPQGNHTILIRGCGFGRDDSDVMLCEIITFPVMVGPTTVISPPPADILTWQVVDTFGVFTIQQEVGSITGPHDLYKLCNGLVCSTQIQ